MVPFDSVRPEDGFDHWHQATCRNYSHTECYEAPPDGRFTATVQSQHFGGLVFSDNSFRIRGGGFALRRGRAHINQDGREEFFLWVGRQGKAMLEQNGREVTLRPGEIMLLDQTEPFKLGFNEVSSTTLLIVERSQLMSRVPWIESAAASKISADTPTARVFVSLLDGLMSAGQPSDEESIHKLESMVLDMWASLLELALARQCTNAAPYKQKLRQAQDFLRANLDDPELDTHAIAKALNLSSRTLLRLFAEMGTTPMRWLMQERLNASYQALAHRRFERVTDVALAFGFSNLSHFSRAFRSAHGISPQQLLRRH